MQQYTENDKQTALRLNVTVTNENKNKSDRNATKEVIKQTVRMCDILKGAKSHNSAYASRRFPNLFAPVAPAG